MDEEFEYAALINSFVAAADQKTESGEQAVDLLADAASFAATAHGVSMQQVMDRIQESFPVFEEAEDMARMGGLQ